MKVRVRYFALFREQTGCASETVNWSGGTAANLFQIMAEKPPGYPKLPGGSVSCWEKCWLSDDQSATMVLVVRFNAHFHGRNAMITERCLPVRLLAACLLLSCVSAVWAEDAPQRWSAEKANAWYKTQPWLVGCNFIPSTAINQLEMWQADTFDTETIDRELGFAAGLGFNTVRVYLHDLAWQADPEGSSGAYQFRFDT